MAVRCNIVGTTLTVIITGNFCENGFFVTFISYPWPFRGREGVYLPYKGICLPLGGQHKEIHIPLGGTPRRVKSNTVPYVNLIGGGIVQIVSGVKPSFNGQVHCKAHAILTADEEQFFTKLVHSSAGGLTACNVLIFMIYYRLLFVHFSS